MQAVCLAILGAPLLGSVIAGLCAIFKRGRKLAELSAISGVAVAFFLALYLLIKDEFYAGTLYTWAVTGTYQFELGFLIDRLSATMMVVVGFVSLMVHIYTIGYMQEDPGYQRFFSYTALFTFFMLVLVTGNNFLQLFIGWEGVGLVSYLLIGFWYQRDSATTASMKAFLVNRVGDFGFLLGIAGVLMVFGSLDYQEVFAQLKEGSYSQTFGITAICILLFIGAMGKSAQVPLHVWLPDSMEGPTPISALIHAATMVTAGIFMVARLSPLYELSEVASSVVLVIGATTALFTGILGIVQHDIKRVIAYSTLSQLGYMVTALGVSAYAAGMFHLFTHAFFKALLFLGAGAVIIAMHHEQNIWKMGNLRKYLPITYVTCLIGALALVGFPGFSGFYSKEVLIDAVHAASIPGSTYAYYAVISGVFITALYTFRLMFVVFHTQERMDSETKSHLHEPAWVVWVPLVLLAIPSLGIAWWTADSVLFGNYFKEAIVVAPQHQVLTEVFHHYQNALHFTLHAPFTIAFWLMVAGIVTAWIFYVRYPALPEKIKQRTKMLNTILANNYGFDAFNKKIFAEGGQKIGQLLWQKGDVNLIDGLLVNGSASSVQRFSGILRHLQSGYLYHYALAMLVGLLVSLLWI